MAELTPLDEKLGEVLGLAQAAQKATTHVAGMEDGDRFRDQLDRMRGEAEETESRTDALIDSLEALPAGKPLEQWADCPAVSDGFEPAWRYITRRVDRLLEEK